MAGGVDGPITDLCAWTGHWASLPVRGRVVEVLEALRRIRVERVCLAPLDGLWAHNPHLCNAAVYEAAARHAEVWPVPLLDPGMPTWAEELGRALQAPRMRLVRLAPNYGLYGLDAIEPFWGALAAAGIGAVVQVRIEDPRRQHPLARVPDVPVDQVVAAARRHKGVKVVIGGAAWKALEDAAEALLQLPNLYAEVSQVDGMDGLRRLVDRGVGHKLLFGTHVPLFMPLAGVARVLTDLEDEAAAAILAGNAAELLD